MAVRWPHERTKQGAGFELADTGSAGSLIPPHEYHAIRNPSASDVAVSLHVYSAPMTCCVVFQPLQSSWYRSDERRLSLDRVH